MVANVEIRQEPSGYDSVLYTEYDKDGNVTYSELLPLDDDTSKKEDEEQG